MKVVFGENQNVRESEQSLQGVGIQSPSARKPRELAELLKSLPYVEFVEPQPLTIDDIKLCHSATYVDGVMSLQEENGFGSKSQAVADSLPYTNGAMYDAAKLATPDMPACALVSGFHHAGYSGWRKLGYFCTFNGLMIAACKFLKEGKRVAIIDCDQHWGNGTDDILVKMSVPQDFINHITFGRFFSDPWDSETYMQWLLPGRFVERSLEHQRPDVILYQAGADAHINDPYGGVLTTEEMQERDHRMFSIAKRLRIPLAWNLAGGYQVDDDGSISRVLDLHLNTFKAAESVYLS